MLGSAANVRSGGLQMAERLIALAADPEGASKRLKEIAEAETRLGELQRLVSEREAACIAAEAVSQERLEEARAVEAKNKRDRQSLDAESTLFRSQKAEYEEALRAFTEERNRSQALLRTFQAELDQKQVDLDHMERALGSREQTIKEREAKIQKAYEALHGA